jgi:hypothetical protein
MSISAGLFTYIGGVITGFMIFHNPLLYRVTIPAGLAVFGVLYKHKSKNAEEEEKSDLNEMVSSDHAQPTLCTQRSFSVTKLKRL